MSTTLSPTRKLSEAFGKESKTAVSKYDIVSGFLVAAVGLVGFITGLLFLLFLLNMEWDKQPQAEMFIFEDLAGFENPEGIAEDFEEPGVEELADVVEPQLADALEMVTDAVSTTRAAIEAVDGTAAQMGTGKGLGDRRQSGLGGGGTGKGNPAEHWIVKYSTSSKEAYAAQLDYFKIEIGSLSKDTSLIEYAGNVSAAKPAYRQGTRKDEKRVYFKKPNNHPVLRWDKALLQAAGAQISNRYIFTFYPPATFKQLFDLEKAALLQAKKQMDDVKRTVFTVTRGGGSGYVYKLTKIEYY
jgi:hypothetical protein